MGLKKTLLTILLAASMGGSCSHVSPKPKLNLIHRFDNNNLSLEDKVIDEAALGVELVETSIRYKVESKEAVYETEVQQRGSGIVLAERDGLYYVLTANHVVNLPSVASSTTAFSSYGGEINDLRDFHLNPKLKWVLSSSTAIVTAVGEPLVLVGGLAASTVCRNPELDYALMVVPSDGTLYPVTNNPQAILGDSAILNAADYTYAVGYSLALGRFISMGNVSSKNLPLGSQGKLTFERSEAFTFTSPISPGNSGGPVFTTADGKMYLVGIAVAYFVRGQNLNIAVKIDDILEDIRKQGCLSFVGELKFDQQSPVKYSSGKKTSG